MYHLLKYAYFILLMNILTNCQKDHGPDWLNQLEAGIPLSLAENRAQHISNLKYQLFFDIPEQLERKVEAKLVLSFDNDAVGNPLILDFKTKDSDSIKVLMEGAALPFFYDKEHLVVEPEFIKKGNNQLTIEFIAGDMSLNRSDAYMYTLLVPDRASTLFPCFDQPNLKAKYQLNLSIPKQWVAVANGAVMDTLVKEKKQYTYKETKPISTYLFAFAVGAFQEETRVVGGREMTLYYREPDPEKAARNFDAIFELHHTALDWMEQYTGIDYPFDKFDFVTIPTFQYGGMEHVGAIFYREGSLFLDESATQNQFLSRASLIAHETAHMWFGDLVTMDWFNDVWLKEVFANFMAAKIVNPSFPDIDHDLRFLLAHQPAAYSEDRTAGTHPIQQVLPNLKDAGTLYGRIIYQKAPVVMRQLEVRLGEQKLQKGLQQYLNQFAFKNATWDDLIAILEQQAGASLKDWSDLWVKTGGMAHYQTLVTQDQVEVMPLKSNAGDYSWSQYSQVVVGKDDQLKVHEINILDTVTWRFPEEFEDPDFVLSNGAPYSYGYFKMTPTSVDYLMSHPIYQISNEVVKGAIWLSMYEGFLNGDIDRLTFLDKIMVEVASEKDPLILQKLLNDLETVFWKFLSEAEWREWAPKIESILWRRLTNASVLSEKAAVFRTYEEVAFTEEALNTLTEIWRGTKVIEGLKLSEADYVGLFATIAIKKGWPNLDDIAQQKERIKNPDRLNRFEFVLPALSNELSVRQTFFDQLKDPENRHYEPWVNQALRYLHHPLRAKSSEILLRPSLELLEEIQQTGDIFFPKSWLNASFSGHQSSEAKEIITTFLEERPNYPIPLKNKINQAADLLYRSVAMKSKG